MIARVRQFFSFPLLLKELTEAAAQRRTYVVRVVYAVLLYVIFMLMIPKSTWSQVSSPFSAMGVGKNLFNQLMFLQFLGIVIFLPALMCGRIAQEKERDSLVLLFLTDLRPWQIVLQKYSGGLVPMLSFLLLGTPLAAMAYGFGGVSESYLGISLLALLLTALQLGSIAIFCSAWCRTTVSAFLSTYFIGAAFYGGPLSVFLLLREFAPNRFRQEWWGNDQYFLYHIPPALVDFVPPGEFLALCAIPVCSIGCFLIAARIGLVRRAFAPPSNFFLTVFRRLDGVMKRLNHRVGNVMLIREKENLPDNAPVHWRETTRRALGRVHYLLRILVLLEIPTVSICVFVALSGGSDADGLSGLAALLAGLAVLTLSVQSANTIVSERLQQTLEVLLTTPMSGRQIVLEKARSLRRLMIVLAIPLLTIFMTEWQYERDIGHYYSRDAPLAYLACAVGMIVIYLPMVMWLSLWIGLRVRTRFRAIITAVSVLVGWCVLPIALAVWGSQETNGAFAREFSVFFFVSPVALGLMNERSVLRRFPQFDAGAASQPGMDWLVLSFTLIFFSALTYLLRWHTLKHADRWLRR